MWNSVRPLQTPSPETSILMFRGDTITFSLALPAHEKGKAWIRTNIGHAAITRKQIIDEVKNDDHPLGRDWFDIPMIKKGDKSYTVTLPLCETGHFEAKCFFLPDKETTPAWPEGGNTVINIEPADTCCANIIYNAFVRQFGPNKRGGNTRNHDQTACIEKLDKAGYAVIPKSGTFRDFISELDFITGTLGCRIIHLLPIHPTPTTYARMGRFGSPYAALSFTAIDPALAEFDPTATPLEQFIELVDAVHARHSKIIIDLAANHTGWAASLHWSHPQWLIRDEAGRIEVPGAWGVKWSDLTSLDYSHKELWHYMTDVFLLWCRRGVDGFRCDAGYMIPVPVWKYIVATVREQFPDTVFFMEGLGGKISVTRNILNTANFNWAYSELFQNYDRGQIEYYLPEAFDISRSHGIMIHFAETHDNPRLAGRSKVYARMRVALCALFSHHGGFGFANGVEWFADQKINVHESHSLNWGSVTNQVKHIKRLTALLKTHPAFFDRVEVEMIQKGKGNHITLLRHHIPSGKKLLIPVNLDDKNHTTVYWDHHKAGIKDCCYMDLLSGKEIHVNESHGFHSCLLDPGQVMCLSPDENELERTPVFTQKPATIPDRIVYQELRAKALEIYCFYNAPCSVNDFQIDHAAKKMAEDPVEYCRNLNPFSREPRVISWHWPRDVDREVMIPPDHFLVVFAPSNFRVTIKESDAENAKVLSCEKSLPCSGGSYFALLLPQPVPDIHRSCILTLSVYTKKTCPHEKAHLLYLAHARQTYVKTVYHRHELLNRHILMLGTNSRGGMLRANGLWGELKSRYDALLAANFNKDVPEDRWIMFTRCRAWLVFQDFSQELGQGCLDSFTYDHQSRGYWQFHIPTGQGEHIFLTVAVEMVDKENTVHITFFRHPAKGIHERLDDDREARIILRPDIEDRNFHETTKAFTGPEHNWPMSVQADTDHFIFSPDTNRKLHVCISKGTFTLEPEWQYMVHRPTDGQRGLDPDSDLFSPGYFSVFIKGGESVQLTARAVSSDEQIALSKCPVQDKTIQYLTEKTIFASLERDTDLKPADALKRAMAHFVVRREHLHTVIAGYPWFLDWGRDTLIFIRGLIAGGKTEKSRAILEQFGKFEKNGTLPNMIIGDDAQNRDTSDAPLWFFAACSDLLKSEKKDDFLDVHCGKKRTIRDTLISIGNSFISGTPNGVRMDPETALVFSPSHFTWMDTSFPAGTPRKGYPVEIQALWYNALSLLDQIDPEKNHGNNWKHLSEKVQDSIHQLFWLEDDRFLSDCLHAQKGQSAVTAEPDNALRPNQLFAITMGAVKDVKICRMVLNACEELLIPGAIRSLADRPVRHPLEIIHNGRLRNNPYHPYQGEYSGDEDTKRKPAYHNGTAWTWVFPSFCEAWAKTYGKHSNKTALAWLAAGSISITQGCTGHVPEIMEGNFPHRQCGCDAQAWGASEFFRVWRLLDE